MNPTKVFREAVRTLADLPNVGALIAADLRLLGINDPQQLTGQCPFELYDRLCAVTGVRHDPCVIDVFMSVTDFISGGVPRPWWHFTQARKQRLTA